MSRIEKDVKKFYKKPIPNDITYEEVKKVANFFGCTVNTKGGRHPLRVVHKESGTVIPIPVHGNTVKEAYIKQLQDLCDMIKEEQK